MTRLAMVLFAAGLISACGATDIERAATGGAAGAVIGQVVSADPLTGAAIGAVAGALCDEANACPEDFTK